MHGPELGAPDPGAPERNAPGRGAPGRMPALYLGHGAPPIVDDPLWARQLREWALKLPRPRAVLMVSAHWESAPLTLGATEPRPLEYDFWGFPSHYYETTYPAPGAPDLAARVRSLLSPAQPVVDRPDRGLDHGAYLPLSLMYPEADVPVLQLSLPTVDPRGLFDLGRRIAPLRDEGVLVVGSGFLTHGLPYLDLRDPGQEPPGWSREFDDWAAGVLDAGDLDQLMDYRRRAPGARYAHPTADHFAPIFVTLGTADGAGSLPETVIDGYWFGLAKRSFQVA